jgi:hypothetical protein
MRTHATNGDVIPFYMQPTVGGSDIDSLVSLRGFEFEFPEVTWVGNAKIVGNFGGVGRKFLACNRIDTISVASEGIVPHGRSNLRPEASQYR